MSSELTHAEAFAAQSSRAYRSDCSSTRFYDRFIADASHPMVKIEHVRHIIGHELSTLAGEWACRCTSSRPKPVANPGTCWTSAIRPRC